MSEDDFGPGLTDPLVAMFGPGLVALGFHLASVLADGVLFDGDGMRFEARYVPRDGDLAVHIIPHATGERLSLLLYLRAIGSDAATRLGEAIAESRDEALQLGREYASGLSDAAALLTGDATELARARGLRWWDVSRRPSGASGDIGGH